MISILNRKILIILIILIALSSIITWFVYKYKQAENQTKISLYQSQEIKQKSDNVSSMRQIAATTTIAAESGLKIYRNKQFGFEFQYLDNWSFYENTFYSPFSKFNLVGASLGKDYQINPPVLINIVTPDFADRAILSREKLGAVTSDIVVGGISGKKYEYTEELPRISIDLPFGKYRMILGAKKQYEDIFNQILASFKFLK
ncbi:MAG: hypothetical protein AAB757_00505 [Patescibacteria group bacterium]